MTNSKFIIKFKILIRRLNIYSNRKIKCYFSFMLFWYIIGIVGFLLAWDNFPLREPSLGWVIVFSGGILCLGAMIINLNGIARTVREQRELLGILLYNLVKQSF